MEKKTVTIATRSLLVFLTRASGLSKVYEIQNVIFRYGSRNSEELKEFITNRIWGGQYIHENDLYEFKLLLKEIYG